MRFPALPDTWPETRATLHAYAQSIIAVNRLAGTVHPKWWHVSMKVRPEGFVTDPVGIPGGGLLGLHVDLRHHVVSLDTTSGRVAEWSMSEGMTGTELAEHIIAEVTDIGIEGTFPRDKFENDEPRQYDPKAASAFHEALSNAYQVLEQVRVEIGDPVGPVQLWPHGFDLAFEWFGTRTERHEEPDGEVKEIPSQINFGFYPGAEPYFYSNPWPFDAELMGHELPHDAAWHDDGWQGSIYHYADVVDSPAAAAKLDDFYRAVHAVASPRLMA